MSGHHFGILVYALLCGRYKIQIIGNGNVFFLNKRMRFARADKAAVALQYHNQ